MKYYTVFSLGAAAAMAMVPSASQARSLANFQAGGPTTQLVYYQTPNPVSREQSDLGPRTKYSHLGPQKIVFNKDTGKTYVVTYLPSGRSLFHTEDGEEFIFDPRTRKLTARN